MMTARLDKYEVSYSADCNLPSWQALVFGSKLSVYVGKTGSFAPSGTICVEGDMVWVGALELPAGGRLVCSASFSCLVHWCMMLCDTFPGAFWSRNF